MTKVKKAKKEHNNGKTAKKRKTTIYRLKFIDSYRFMQCSLSILVDNLPGIDNKKPENKFGDTIRSMTDSLSQSINKISEIDRKILQKNKLIDIMRSMMTSLSQSINKISDIDRKISQIDKKEPDNKFIDNMRSMMTSLSLSFDKVSEIDNKISQAPLIEKFPNTYQLCNKDLNKFALLLRKGVYPYEYMDTWERFNEESLPDKESFYSELYNEHITDEDYAHAQKVWSSFNVKGLGETHDLYVQSDTALLADVFESFKGKCREI